MPYARDDPGETASGGGSGFLALDRNGDGKVNNGGEMFGTKTGNGFAELAAYDADGNGWIGAISTLAAGATQHVDFATW